MKTNPEYMAKLAALITKLIDFMPPRILMYVDIGRTISVETFEDPGRVCLGEYASQFPEQFCSAVAEAANSAWVHTAAQRTPSVIEEYLSIDPQTSADLDAQLLAIAARMPLGVDLSLTIGQGGWDIRAACRSETIYQGDSAHEADLADAFSTALAKAQALYGDARTSGAHVFGDQILDGAA